MKIKGAIFDFDGTLFDSMEAWESAGVNYLIANGYTPEESLWNKLKVLSLRQSAEYLKNGYSLPYTVEDIMDGINKTVEDFYKTKALPKENVINFLKELKKRGVKLCIATATERSLIEIALDRFNMADLFEEIFTCTALGHGKDEPYIYEYAQKFMSLKKDEVAVFEDACYAAKTAKSAKFFVVGIYDRFELYPDRLKEYSDIYIQDFNDTVILSKL